MKKKELASLQNPLIKHLVKLRQNSDYRHEHQTVVVEGPKLIQELCKKVPAKVILAYDETFVPKGVKAEELILVTEAVMHKISGVQSPEGILAEIPLPKPATLAKKKYIIAVDGVSDPGNLGTILRTALALGWEGAFILPDSCDPFNEKALRASRGAVFRLPLAYGNWKQLSELIKKNQIQPYVADIEGKKVDKISAKEGILLVLSNEAHGISEEAEANCVKVTIPMQGEMESLNVSVAGGILMYMLREGK